MHDPIIDTLNEGQRRAVTTIHGAVLVLAGPGSGKTRVLTHRIAHMIRQHDVAPWQIMAVTFTNKAASEMRERIENLIGGDARDLRLGTFHAMCARILRREVEATPYKPNFTIYDTADQQALIKGIVQEMQKDPKQHRPNAILSQISAAKNEMVMPDDYPGSSYKEDVVREVYRRYMQKLQASNAMDFDDLLMQTVLLLRRHEDIREKYHRSLQFLLVDEFQDTNMVQYELMRILSAGHGNLFVVGDPDQSIYAFRGADYRNVRRFRDEQPDHKLITLNENYRSHQLILDAAMAVIRKDPSHIRRDLISPRTNGALVEIHELQNDSSEGQFVINQILRLQREEGYVPRDFAVMYRTNAQSRVMEEAFVRANMPYRIVGGTRFYERKEIKDLLGYLRLVNNPDDSVSFNRIINTPPRGIGQKTQETFVHWADERGQGLWDAMQALRSGAANPLSARAARSIADFVSRLESWIAASLLPESSPLDVLDAILEGINYLDHLEDKAKDGDPDRTENVRELRRQFAESEGYSLREVLEDISLVADIDGLDDKENAPTMLTLHAAKGLEYPVVFIVGMEEGLLPHERSLGEANQMAEERRLLYVGITRAKDRLYLSHAAIRSSYQGPDYREPSRFLDDLPPDAVRRISPWRGSSGGSRLRQTAASTTTWASSAPKKVGGQRREAQFKTGAAVRHKVFGKGVVISSRVNPDMEEVMVKFEDGGVKTLDGSFLQTD